MWPSEWRPRAGRRPQQKWSFDGLGCRRRMWLLVLRKRQIRCIELPPCLFSSTVVSHQSFFVPSSDEVLFTAHTITYVPCMVERSCFSLSGASATAIVGNCLMKAGILSTPPADAEQYPKILTATHASVQMAACSPRPVNPKYGAIAMT